MFNWIRDLFKTKPKNEAILESLDVIDAWDLGNDF